MPAFCRFVRCLGVCGVFFVSACAHEPQEYAHSFTATEGVDVSGGVADIEFEPVTEMVAVVNMEGVTSVKSADDGMLANPHFLNDIDTASGKEETIE